MAEYTIDKIEYNSNVYNLQDNVSGYITGISSSDVTTALGYTPLSSSSTLDATKLSGTIPAECYTDTDTKMTQTYAAESGYSYWRPLIIGYSSGSAEGFTPSTVTNTAYAFKSLTVQPSTGTIRVGNISLYKGSYTVKFSPTTLTANRTITVPNATGTLALTSDIPTIPSDNVTGSGSTDYLARWSGTNTLATTSLSVSTSYNSSSDEYGTIKLYVGSTGQIDWKGQLVFYDGNSNTITITPPSLTGNRTITLPDKTGTIALTSDLPTVPSNIVNTITTTAGTHTAITNATGTVSFKVPTTAAHVGAASSSHTHGNITNGGDITATAPTIASGDQIIINDHSASKITNGPTFDGSTTTTALTPKGTWESFAKSDTNTTYTLSGALSSHKFTSTLTAGGSGSGTSTSDFTLAAGTGITITDDASNRKMTIACSVTNTDAKVSTAAVTSGTLYYPIVGADTTSAATKFYDKTGITYQATNGVPYDYTTGDAILTLGNNTSLSSNGWKRGVLRLYSRYDYYTNLVSTATSHSNEVNLPEGSGTLALQTELPSISSVHVMEDTALPGTYSTDLSNFDSTANINYLALDLVNSSGGLEPYILTDYYVEPVTVDDYYYEIWWFTGVFRKIGDFQSKITCGIYLDSEEQYHTYGEATVDIKEIGERYTINGGDTGYTTNISTTADQFKQLAVLNLSAGRWIVTARARFIPNSSSNHYSAINIGTSTAGSGSTTTGNAIRDRRYGEGTYFNQHALTRIISLAADVPVYLNGSSNVAGVWNRTSDVFQFDAIRIS